METQDEGFIVARRLIAEFRKPIVSVAARDLALALGIYAASTGVSLLFLHFEYQNDLRIVLFLPIYLICGLAIAKIFTIQHDCGHDSYFSSSVANRMLGRACSVVTFIPFTAWKEEHELHHASFGNFAAPTFGDVWLLTVEKYNQSHAFVRIVYRILRSPVFLLTVAPVGYLLVRQRFPTKLSKPRLCSAIVHTVGLAAIYGAGTWWLGATFAFAVFPPLYIAGIIGVLIFFVEHQFENSEWTVSENWKFARAAVISSSYLSMPSFLEWFTGNIGYHHIHHLNQTIPSYRLKDCFIRLGEMLPYKEVKLASIPRQLRLTLWSREKRGLVSFREASLLHA